MICSKIVECHANAWGNDPQKIPFSRCWCRRCRRHTIVAIITLERRSMRTHLRWAVVLVCGALPEHTAHTFMHADMWVQRFGKGKRERMCVMCSLSSDFAACSTTLHTATLLYTHVCRANLHQMWNSRSLLCSSFTLSSTTSSIYLSVLSHTQTNKHTYAASVREHLAHLPMVEWRRERSVAEVRVKQQ